MPVIPQRRLRAAFARRLSEMYGQEVPAYRTLVEVSREVNDAVLARLGGDAERLGSIDRVSAERHGAIRVGTPAELQQVARIFGALGMRPVGFYDLRDAATSAVPVVSTAFRPVEADELAYNPFRVFTSMLTPADRRFFDPDLGARLTAFLAARELFPPELLDLADRAELDGGLPEQAAERFLDLAARSFALSTEPIDKSWYETLEQVSAVAADIGGVASTHINHLTPRVLDIDDLYRRMTERGITMIDKIQGPPRWSGPDVLLRQTSFRALAEPRRLRLPDGRVETGALRVRFGEVEARGIALTRAGRERYDALMTRTDTGAPDAARKIWEDDPEGFPASERGLAVEGLGYFTYHAVTDRAPDGRRPSADLADLIDQGWVRPEPIVYEDFLPRSAAGIFQSNLTGEGRRDDSRDAAGYDADRLAEAIGRPVLDPYALYQDIQDRSLEEVARALDLPAIK
ncbi:2-oxoadipate dioxygenase/decarboxylase [Spongiactinospora rosea]|uniref:2-oxoadipate dioxygenase/decarboxylase n=1 Tax=Spongiactinospora rosea TaxID=2248750 RepID=UPI0018F3FCBD|nr:VOC family protein [Spongiactinospora rosea]